MDQGFQSQILCASTTVRDGGLELESGGRPGDELLNCLPELATVEGAIGKDPPDSVEP